MHWRVERIFEWLAHAGIDPQRGVATARGVGPFLSNLKQLKQQRSRSSEQFALGRFFPQFGDRFDASGVGRGHYFHQDLLVARRVFERRPLRHVDVGSRFDGFVAHVAVFRAIEVFDIRALRSSIANISFVQADLTAPLPAALHASTDSLSCLHALEHFGLGRYGDPVNYEGHRRGLDNLHALLQPGGTLYLSVPIGPQRIEFDAHRVFAVSHLLQLLDGRFAVSRFHYVDDAGDLHADTALEPQAVRANFGCNYGCGIFELTKV